MRDVTLKVWPEMKWLPQHVTDAAMLFNVGDFRTLTRQMKFKKVGSGIQAVAYVDKEREWIVKGRAEGREKWFDSWRGKWTYGDDDESPIDGLLRFALNITSSKERDRLLTLAREFVAPSVIIGNVIIQTNVRTIAAAMKRSEKKFTVIHNVNRIADMLGITDVHDHNWGFDNDGKVKIFDIGFTSTPEIATLPSRHPADECATAVHHINSVLESVSK